MKYFLFFLSSVMLLHVSYAQPGTLDPSFANNGTLIDTVNTSVYIEKAPVAVQKDGKIIIGSDAYLQNTTVLRVTRYLSDGTLDTSFGVKGNAYGSIYNGYRVTALALQQDEKIVAMDGNSETITRFNVDGSLDSSFGANGSTQIISVNSGYEFYAMLVQPDGKILLGGVKLFYDDLGQVKDELFATLRIMPNGKLDKSFGNGGEVTSEKGYVVQSLLLQPDGKIVAGGYNLDKHLYIERYFSNGTIDKGFGADGSVLTIFDAHNTPSKLNGMALQKDGKIVATGTDDELIPSLLLARYNSDEQLDKTFNDSGKIIAQFPAAGAEGVSVFVMPNNKIVVAGNNISHLSGNSDFALTCYNDDGSLDQTFGDNGSTFTDIGGNDAVTSAALQPDGKVVVSGISYHTTKPYYTIGVARYNGFDANKQPLMVRIKRWMQHHGISWQTMQSSNNIRYYVVQRSIDGNSYKEIAKVSSGVFNYEDFSPPNTNNYYRIVAVSTDGSRAYSNAILVNETQQARIFPNPVRDNLQLQGLPSNSKSNISIIDLNGNVRSTATATGTNSSVNIANLTSGSYLLKIQHDGTATTLPFVKE